MKLLLILLLSIPTMAATIDARPFKINIITAKSDFNVSMELTLACRYEKFVFGDSAKYETTFKEVPISVRATSSGYVVENKRTVSHKVDGYFRSNKGCYAISKLRFTSKKYAVGWANQYDRPISLMIYESSRPSDYVSFNADKLIDIAGDKRMTFKYRAVGNQVNIKMNFGGKDYNSMSTYARTTALRYKDSGFPYPL